MFRNPHLRTLAVSLSLLTLLSHGAFADNGIIVSGQVIGIDPINQIMRVHVTGVNGIAFYGSPQTNYVDYLVSRNTVVVGPNNQFVSQSNVLIGSQIQMQFVGAYASAIVLIGNNNFTSYVGGFVTPSTAYRNNSVSPYQSYGSVTGYTSVVIRPRNQNNVMHNNVMNFRNLSIPNLSRIPKAGGTRVPPT